ncbi:hypothetical protein K6959_00635 [Bacillus aquiflavi]|nr:hypothetical protein [Bacillus aquiflavi]UAC48546.1 hypothetical protein K6959_00635 [Bacillus aquiflavi]
MLEEKKQQVSRFIQVLDREIYECYDQWRTNTIRKIDHMEQSPSSYTRLFHQYGFSPMYHRTITKLNIHENISPMRNMDMSVEINKLNESVERGFIYIEKYRKAIEELFDEEMRVAQRFDLAEVVYNG